MIDRIMEARARYIDTWNHEPTHVYLGAKEAEELDSALRERGVVRNTRADLVFNDMRVVTVRHPSYFAMGVVE